MAVKYRDPDSGALLFLKTDEEKKLDEAEKKLAEQDVVIAKLVKAVQELGGDINVE